MSIKHTLGPWQSNGVRVICENSERSNTSICICVPNFTKDDSCYANAQLISAAPEMLDALKLAEIAVEELCQGQHIENQCWVILSQVRSVITKAEGRS